MSCSVDLASLNGSITKSCLRINGKIKAELKKQREEIDSIKPGKLQVLKVTPSPAVETPHTNAAAVSR